MFSFNSHNRNSEGFHDPIGKVTFLEFRSMTPRKNFLKTFVVENVCVSAKT